MYLEPKIMTYSNVMEFFLLTTIISDPLPLSFTNGVLDGVVGHEMYSFMAGFSGYNQMWMAPEDQDKIAFVTEWGVLMAIVMIFGLKTALSLFQRSIVEIFAPFIPNCMRVFFYDFALFRKIIDHIHSLIPMLTSLNLVNCPFVVSRGMMLGHIVSKNGIPIDIAKVAARIKAPSSKNTKETGQFLGKERWHSQVLRYLADVASPLHTASHKEKFEWTRD